MQDWVTEANNHTPRSLHKRERSHAANREKNRKPKPAPSILYLYLFLFFFSRVACGASSASRAAQEKSQRITMPPQNAKSRPDPDPLPIPIRNLMQSYAVTAPPPAAADPSILAMAAFRGPASSNIPIAAASAPAQRCAFFQSSVHSFAFDSRGA